MPFTAILRVPARQIMVSDLLLAQFDGHPGLISNLFTSAPYDESSTLTGTDAKIDLLARMKGAVVERGSFYTVLRWYEGQHRIVQGKGPGVAPVALPC